MNNVSIIGRLVAKPELRTTTAGKKFCSFAIACNGINSEVDFIDCVVWGKQAENLCEYQDKGNLIGITGRLTTNTYENKDGYKIKKTLVSVNSLEFLTTRPKTQDAKVVEAESDPFADFGETVTIDDNFLE